MLICGEETDPELKIAGQELWGVPDSGCRSRAHQTTTAGSGPRSLLIPALIPRIRFPPHRSELALLVIHVGIRLRSLRQDLCVQWTRGRIKKRPLTHRCRLSVHHEFTAVWPRLFLVPFAVAPTWLMTTRKRAGLGALAWSVIQGLNGLSCLPIGITPRHSCVWPDVLSVTPPPRLRYGLSTIPQWRFALLHA
jgi:hypothetical protein